MPGDEHRRGGAADVRMTPCQYLYPSDVPSYVSEPQAYFLLSVLCDRLLPGYYSQTMYGTLLDQKVFESLVEKTMPILWDHLVKSDVQLSVVSLPWFLSLYINSMPLIFAFRVLDVFFLEGPKVLFQIGLAILRINGEQLLDAADDGSFISVLKSYFSRLDESAHPKSENPKLRAVTRFQELMVVAFKEFAGITQNTISEQRARHKDAVLENIENFAKRTSIRNLGPESKKLSVNDLGFLYDRFYAVLYERQQRAEIMQQEAERKAKASRAKATEIVSGFAGGNAEKGRVALGVSPTHMDYDAFREFLAGESALATRMSHRLTMSRYRQMGRHRFANITQRAKHAADSLVFRRQHEKPTAHVSMGLWTRTCRSRVSQTPLPALGYGHDRLALVTECRGWLCCCQGDKRHYVEHQLLFRAVRRRW